MRLTSIKVSTDQNTTDLWRREGSVTMQHFGGLDVRGYDCDAWCQTTESRADDKIVLEVIASVTMDNGRWIWPQRLDLPRPYRACPSTLRRSSIIPAKWFSNAGLVSNLPLLSERPNCSGNYGPKRKTWGSVMWSFCVEMKEIVKMADTSMRWKVPV